MYCKKCKYHSFDHISSCPKCGVEWEDMRKALNLVWMTGNGVNWITPEKPAARTEIVMSPLLAAEHDLDFSSVAQDPLDTGMPVMAEPPSAVSRGPEIEIALSPDLDFSAPSASPAPAPAAAAPQPGTNKKYGDSFLPELEEMLAPLGGSQAEAKSSAPKPKPWAAPKPAANIKFDHEVDSLLDFVSSSSAQDDDFLSLNIEEKK